MAESVKFQIKRGLREKLALAEIIEGCWYLTTDTNELFVGTGASIEQVNQHIIFCKTRAQLPIRLLEGIVYVIEDENYIGRYDSDEGKLVVMNSGSDYREITRIVGGSASDSWDN